MQECLGLLFTKSNRSYEVTCNHGDGVCELNLVGDLLKACASSLQPLMNLVGCPLGNRASSLQLSHVSKVTTMIHRCRTRRFFIKRDYGTASDHSSLAFRKASSEALHGAPAEDREQGNKVRRPRDSHGIRCPHPSLVFLFLTCVRIH